MEQFFISPLTDKEDKEIKTILVEMHHSEDPVEFQIDGDLKILTDITTEIKAIEKQGVLLHGERITQSKRGSKEV